MRKLFVIFFSMMTITLSAQQKANENPFGLVYRGAITHYMTEAVFKNATGTSDKELFIVKGATHMETYWKPEYVDQIVKKLSTFYGRILKEYW